MALTYDSISTTTVSTTATSITLSSLPTNFTDLRLVFSGDMSNQTYWQLQFNSVTTSDYSFAYMANDGNFNQSQSSNSATAINLCYAYIMDKGLFGVVDIMGYRSTTAAKSILSYTQGRGPTTAGGIYSYCVGTWNSTSAITSITLLTGTTFQAGFKVNLYGITAA